VRVVVKCLTVILSTVGRGFGLGCASVSIGAGGATWFRLFGHRACVVRHYVDGFGKGQCVVLWQV
jgi:hypothetical protein